MLCLVMCVWGPLLGAVCLPHRPGKQRVLVGCCSSTEARHGAGGCGVPQACARRLTTYAGLCLVSIWQHGCQPCSTCFPCSLHTAVQHAAVSLSVSQWELPLAHQGRRRLLAGLQLHVQPCLDHIFGAALLSDALAMLAHKRKASWEALDCPGSGHPASKRRIAVVTMVSSQSTAVRAWGGLWSICACASCPAKGLAACVAVPCILSELVCRVV